MEYKKGDYFRKGFSFQDKNTKEAYKFYEGDVLYFVIHHISYLGYDVIKTIEFKETCSSIYIDLTDEEMKRCLIGSNVIEFKLKRNNEIKTIGSIDLNVIGGVYVG